jgi:Glucose-6-phosphate dehydrogenase, C-terminal domain
MKFRYKDYFKAEPATGYETLIYDCLIGDNMLFQRADSIEAGWQAVQPILDAWKKAGATGLEFYPAGSEGSPAFELLTAMAVAGGSSDEDGLGRWQPADLRFRLKSAFDGRCAVYTRIHLLPPTSSIWSRRSAGSL